MWLNQTFYAQFIKAAGWERHFWHNDRVLNLPTVRLLIARRSGQIDQYSITPSKADFAGADNDQFGGWNNVNTLPNNSPVRRHFMDWGRGDIRKTLIGMMNELSMLVAYADAGSRVEERFVRSVLTGFNGIEGRHERR